MKRPVVCLSQQGLLLVEAVLAAAVIAVGLVFISRGLASQLAALRGLDARGTLSALASQRLLELEGICLSGATLVPERSGTYDAPYQDYQWAVGVTPRDDITDDAGTAVAGTLTIDVWRAAGPAMQGTLSTVWRRDWLPEGWR